MGRTLVALAIMLTSSAAVFAIDLVSKRLVTRSAAARPAGVGRVVRIRPVLNPRAWGGWTPMAGLALWAAIAAALTLGLASSAAPFDRAAVQAALGMALGGALGNLVDRLRRGAVLDFIDLGWWPVFNLGDVAIVGGAAAAAWCLFVGH